MTEIYTTFAIAMLPFAFAIRLWKHSVTAFLMVLAGAWCALALPQDERGALAVSVPFVLEVVAVIRAVSKPGGDRWIPNIPKHTGDER